MRTTMNTIYAKIQTNLNKITTDMSRVNEQISSGQQMNQLSDEPVNLVNALRFRSSIIELDQYTENIQNGNTIITSSESALTSMKELALRAKTLSIQATDPGYTIANREAIATEVQNLFEQAVYLANTQINGKYIFGGLRTTGYTDLEPTPFIVDKGDGHWINGVAPAPIPPALSSSGVQSAATNTDLVAGDLLINGVDIGAVDLTTVPDVAGVNMQGAFNLKDAINLHAGLHGGLAATADPAGGTGSKFSFDLNGAAISVTIPDGATATAVANATIAAINLKTADSGVTAILGDGTNGGPVDSVVFTNAQAGDNSTITVANFTTTLDGGAALGFTDFSQKIVTATLTTQGAGATSAGATGGELIDFTVNGVRIAYTTSGGGATAAAAAQQAVDAINAAQDKTGVTAILGDGTNGGPANAVILQNTLAGDETDIVVAGITNLGIPLPHAAPYDEAEITGLSDGTYSVGAGNNTGQISLSSRTAIDLNTSSATSTLIPKDTILNRIGLGGGSVGNFDAADDGQLVYGYPLTAGELKVNGIAVPATTDDGLSEVYADASAAAKAAAINSIESQTGVTAVVINAEAKATGSVSAGTEASRPTGVVTNTVIRANELSINGILLGTEISSGAVTNGLNMEKAFNAKTAINIQSLNTNVLGRLTTLLPKPNVLDAATTGVATNVSFKINGTDVNVTTGGISGNKTASDVVAAINALKATTGVEARVGDGSNGGVSNSIVLFNSIKGNEDAIIISGLDSPAEDFLSLANNDPLGQAADATHNTGEISLESEYPITIATPTISPGADVVINELGFSSKNVTGFGGQTSVTSTVTGVPIAANTVYVNGIATGAIAGGAPINGINMDMAASAKTQIETADPNVHVNLTTLTQGAAATTTATQDTNITFKVNGEQVTVSYPDTTLDTNIAFLTVQAINSVTQTTGVQAYIGTGTNDGSAAGSAPVNTIVFRNLTSGNDAAITVSDFTVNYGNNDLGFTDFSQTADATHNTGEITISSATTFDLSTPLTLNDSVLNELGLGYNALTGYSEKDDGIFYASDGTGEGQASFGASPKYMSTGDLKINGTDIFTTPTAVLREDQTNTVIDAINAQTATTGVQATRGSDGIIRLIATDGRNIHIQTSMNGESITHLTGGSRDQASFGSLQLRADRKFILETIDPVLNANEPGLASLGLAGGETKSGEPNDVAGDGKIDVFSIHDRPGSVRYAGDRVNDLEIKIGKTTTMNIGDNGMTGVMDTSIFSTLKSLQNYLLNTNFSTVTGIHSATDTSVLLNSKTTGLEPESQLPTEDLFNKGTFTVTVIDHDYSPARTSPMTIAIDPSVDTLQTVATRIDGIPHVNASWDSEGHLTIASSDPGRYTIALADIDSNFLKATGVSSEFMQLQGITQSISDLDTLMENLTRQISNFGARANRIDVQSRIYSTMTIATKENLSEVQDTDMIQAVMDLKAKETAYQAALSAAAKTMQLSLVDYLR